MAFHVSIFKQVSAFPNDMVRFLTVYSQREMQSKSEYYTNDNITIRWPSFLTFMIIFERNFLEGA